MWVLAAPEVISQGNTGNYDGKAVDVWACGVMLFVMLFCQYPFERPEDEQEKIQTKRYQMVRPCVCAVSRTCCGSTGSFGRLWGLKQPQALALPSHHFLYMFVSCLQTPQYCVWDMLP